MKIHTKKGLININEIIIGDEILTTNGYKAVNIINFLGKQKIFKIKTENGFIKSYKNQKFAIKKDNNFIWKNAEELKNGDFLITTRIPIEGSDIKLPFIINNSNRKDRINIPDFNGEISWLFGFFYGNGIILNNSIKVITNNISLLDKCIKYFSYFGENIHTIIDKNKIDNIYSIELISKNLTNYFKDYFKSDDIPYFINETCLANRREYIKGVLSSKINNNYNITSNSTNNWLYSFHILCFSCGFETKYVELKNSQKLIFESSYSINLINDININNNDNIKYIYNKIDLVFEENNEIDIYDINVIDNQEYFFNGHLCHSSIVI
jgi:hypothetical protein